MPISTEQARQSLQKVRQKHPQYEDMGDEDLATRLADKYPQYQDIASAITSPAEQDAQQPRTTTDIPGVTEQEMQALDPSSRAKVKLAHAEQQRYGGRGLPATPGGRGTAEERIARNVSGDIAERMDAVPTAPGKAAASGLMQTGLSTMSLMRRGAEFSGLAEEGGADALIELSDMTSAGRNQATEDAWTPEIILQATEGSSRTIGELVLFSGAGKALGAAGKSATIGRAGQAAGASVRAGQTTARAARAAKALRAGTKGARAAQRVKGAAPVLGGFGASVANRAITEGKEAGLEGKELAAYAVGQGSLEAGITAAFQAVGLGGLEAAKQPVREGVKTAFKHFIKSSGMRSIGEVPEELVVESMQKLTGYLQGVDNAATLTPEEATQVTLQAIMSSSAMSVGRDVDQAARQKIRDRLERRMREGAEVSEDSLEEAARQPDAKITDPSRLLPAPQTVEERVEAAERTAEEKALEAQRQPTSGQTIMVDEQGRAMSQDQADALDQAGAQFAQQQEKQAQTQPKALPAPTRRFEASEEGIRDLTDPQAERRTQAPEGRQEVNRLREQGNIEAANQRINELETEIRTDPTTGEGNKYLLDEVGPKIEKRAKRRKAGQPVVFMDLDNLHTANEVLGHEAMDAQMKDIARIIREESGDRATVTRQGGDEFAVVWTGGQSQREARRTLERVQKRVGRQKIAPGVSFGLTGGVGVVKPGGSFSDAFKQADAQATAQKRASKAERGEETGREEAVAAAQATQQTEEPNVADAPSLRLSDGPEAEQRRRANLRSIETQRREERKSAWADEAQRRAQAVAEAYKQRTGLGTQEPGQVEQVKPELAQRIAHTYENAEHNPEDEQTQESYNAFKEETLAQFNALKEAGYTFSLESADEVAERYPDAQALTRDLGQNQHLAVARDPGDMPDDHPLMETAPGADGWTYNQVFRAVHDVLGHSQTGNNFDMVGEENAWRSHASMYSEKARGALATETRAQSNWIGYGPYGQQNRRKIKEGKTSEVVFPEQKATLLPDTYWSVPGMRPRPEQRDQQQVAVTVTQGRQARKAGRQATKKIMGSKTIDKFIDSLDDMVDSISARIAQIDPDTFRRVKQMFFDMGVTEERFLYAFDQAMDTVHQEVGSWNTDLGRRVSAALQTNREDAKALLSEEGAAAIEEAGQLFDTLRARARDAGIEIGDVEGFWPRVVTDIDGLRTYLDETQKGELDRALQAARNVRGQDLTHEEKVTVINQAFRGRGPVDPGKIGPRHTRTRTLETVTEEMIDLYQNPTKSAHSYIRDLAKATERAKFFGRKEVQMENVDGSVGQHLAEKVARGEITPDQQEQLQKLVRALFVGDMGRSGMATRLVKQMGYFSFLTNFKSAMTQLADAAGNVYLNGPTSAIRGYGDALRRKGSARRMTMEEMGIHDYGAEWDDVGRMNSLLDMGLRIHGFKRLDRLGKEAFLNATKHRLRQAASNPNGKAARNLKERYGNLFTEREWSEMFHDARQGKLTEQLRFLAFLHISNIQPIDVSETPVGYANNSNIFANNAIQTRMLYTLKTFMFKRLSFIRHEVTNDIKNGNKKRAARRLATLFMLWSGFEIPIDLLKDFLRGRLRWDNFPDVVVDNMLQIVGMNRYILDEARQDPVGAAANYFTGAIGGGIVNDAFSDAYQLATGETYYGYDATPGSRFIRHMPIFGDSLYYLSPWGEGYHITDSQDQRRAKSRMDRVRSEAEDALKRGDKFQASVLLNMYNENKHITGRKTNLTVRELRRTMTRARKNPLDNDTGGTTLELEGF